MVKKMKSSAARSNPRSKAAGLMDSQLAASVKESAQQIWLAGMGAFKQAQEEGDVYKRQLQQAHQALHDGQAQALAALGPPPGDLIEQMCIRDSH